MAVLKKMGDNLDMQVLSGGELTCEAALEGLATGDDCLYETKNFSYGSVYGIPAAANKNEDYTLVLFTPALISLGHDIPEGKLGRWCSPHTEKGTAFCKSLSGKPVQTLGYLGVDQVYPF